MMLTAPASLSPERGGMPGPDRAGFAPAPEADEPDAGDAQGIAPVWRELSGSFRPQSQNQVRIEQRVIIRIAPRRPSVAPDILSDLPQGEVAPQYEERKMGKCVPIKGIAGVQANSDNRLLLFLRDRRIVAINLEKSCRARDFYSGFYVEPNEDGLLCVGRDKLHSRSGANCDLDRMRQLVLVRR
ncbi:MAG: hypothetical protein PHE36_03210 [Novosphingobium sp.]|nr:hypothetical protein [Novosphingobium sp.]